MFTDREWADDRAHRATDRSPDSLAISIGRPELDWAPGRTRARGVMVAGLIAVKEIGGIKGEGRLPHRESPPAIELGPRLREEFNLSRVLNQPTIASVIGWGPVGRGSRLLPRQRLRGGRIHAVATESSGSAHPMLDGNVYELFSDRCDGVHRRYSHRVEPVGYRTTHQRPTSRTQHRLLAYFHRRYRRFQHRPSRFASQKRRCADRRVRRRKSSRTPEMH
jgi:hypothetical protein